MHLLPAPLSRLMGSRALLSRLRAFRSLFDRTPGESDALNGLRAISILLIFGLHVYGPGGSLLGWPPLVDRLVRNLTSSLDLFFVLSGFLVYGRLVRNFDLPAHASNAGSESKGNRSTWTILATYLRGRVLRIVPAYYAALIGSLWFLLDLRSHSARSGMLDAVERVNRALSSGWSDVFFVSNYLPDRLLDAGWSLSVEVQYYIYSFFSCRFWFACPGDGALWFWLSSILYRFSFDSIRSSFVPILWPTFIRTRASIPLWRGWWRARFWRRSAWSDSGRRGSAGWAGP